MTTSGRTMIRLSVVKAKAQFSRILAEAAAGREVVITRRGMAVARVSGMAGKKKPLDLRAVRAFRATLVRNAPAAAALIRQVRDQRY
jgi:prevent-host-death family protein